MKGRRGGKPAGIGMRFLLLAALSLTIAACSREVDASKLVERQGVFYEVNSTTPFSGTMVSYHDNGQLEEKTQLRDGLLHGKFSLFFTSGQLDNIGEFEAGKPVGVHKAYYDDGALRSSTNYSDGQMDGLSEFYYDDGALRSSTNYSDGQMDGLSEFYYDDGALLNSTNYSDGQMDGLSEFYWSNGVLKMSTNYSDGQMDGLSEGYYENGQLRETGTYAEGRKDGEWLAFFSSGSIKEWSEWENGTQHGGSFVVTAPNTTFATVGRYERGVKDGEWLTYILDSYPRIRLSSKSEFVSGQSNGYQLHWHLSGTLWSIDPYKDGLKDGCWGAMLDKRWEFILYNRGESFWNKCTISAEELAAFSAFSSFPDPSSFLPEELRQYATWCNIRASQSANECP